MAEPTPILDGIIYRYIIYNEETYFAYAYAPSRPLCSYIFHASFTFATAIRSFEY